jgi:hypothetical protein
LREHGIEIGIVGSGDGGGLGGGFCSEVVVEDFHSKGGMGFLCEEEADVAEAYDTYNVAFSDLEENETIG